MMMARTLRTARKRVSIRATQDEIRWEYLHYGMCWRDTLGEFLAHFHEHWLAASMYGISSYDGIIRLLTLLPSDWKGWATSIASDYLYYYGEEYDLYVDFPSFVAVVSYQYFCYGAAPHGPYTLPGDYIQAGGGIADFLPRDNPAPYMPPELVQVAPLLESDTDDEIAALLRSPTPIYLVISSDSETTPQQTLTSNCTTLGTRTRDEFEAGPSRTPGVPRDHMDSLGMQPTVGTIRREPIDLNQADVVVDSNDSHEAETHSQTIRVFLRRDFAGKGVRVHEVPQHEGKTKTEPSESSAA
ncbi:uncharacterized protein LOC131004304 isoform X2 [Salvia miltiorrhiza]|uniref:uncharacterized protein LOC131004304 isoform X2 n=1 Tax=Salvia miltiorrhiza TaxID=226208 RepID=UPI0025AB6245|nr:uncharacterized protein LOC131004304 isoform X2 [Salvia miltiorrhiza]XP_057786937.1 uncharacterized protein LOC131004304 isoform X2 [Salvia miltiorrhiza]